MDLSGKYYKAFTDRQAAIEKQYSHKQAEKQHSKGKLTAHERIKLLFDNSTFEEIDAFVTPADQPVEFGKVERSYGDGVIVGHGKINGRLVFAYAQDFTIMGGSLGIVHAKKIAKIQEMALKMGSPIIALIDSGGAGRGCQSQRVRRYFSEYNSFLRNNSPDICYYGAGRWRGCLLSSSHRFCLYGKSYKLYVCNRT
jgi:acetyl-CoA carboxylase carboxyltransferase component